MGWMQNKTIIGEPITKKINGKQYRYAGRAKNKTELKQAKSDLKKRYGSVRSVDSKGKGKALYVRKK